MARKTMALAEPLRRALAPLVAHIHAAFVYGSVVKWQDTARSNIDLMLVSAPRAGLRPARHWTCRFDGPRQAKNGPQGTVLRLGSAHPRGRVVSGRPSDDSRATS